MSGFPERDELQENHVLVEYETYETTEDCEYENDETMEDHKNCGDELGKDKTKATLKRGLQMKNYQIINFLFFYHLIVIWTCIPGRGKWLVWGWRTLTFVLLFVCLVILICLFSKQDQHQKALDEILESLNTSTSTGSIIQTEPAGCEGKIQIPWYFLLPKKQQKVCLHISHFYSQ